MFRWYLSSERVRVRARVRVLRAYLGLYLGEEGAQVGLCRGKVVQGLARREDARIGEQLVVPQHLVCVGGDD